MKPQLPFGLSLSKPRLHALPFDRLRANGSNFNGPDQYVWVLRRAVMTEATVIPA
jgi:hypothetical protein